MRAADLLTSALWLAFGLGLIWAGRANGYGTAGEPGSGFLVVWVGLFMTVVAGCMLVLTLRTAADGKRLGDLWRGARVHKVALAVAALTAFTVVMQEVGFLIGAALLLLVLFRTIEPLGWAAAAAAALLGAVGTWLLFKVLLGTQLPSGWLG